MTYFSREAIHPKGKRIAFLAFDGMSILDLTGPFEIFVRAKEMSPEKSFYELCIVGLRSKRIISESGLVVQGHRTIDKASGFDTIIVPGGHWDNETERGISSWLRQEISSTRRFASVSTGAYALADAGLLDNRNVTTHWRHSHLLGRRFPKLKVNHTAVFLKDDSIYTSGGGKAGVEMALALIHEDMGLQIARQLAKEFVMQLRPPGDDERLLRSNHFEASPVERLVDLPSWISAHLHENLSVDTLAEKAGLSRRQFTRLFKRTFDCGAADFVEKLRLSESRKRLLMPRTSVDSVAQAVGFNSGDCFRRAFERCFGLTPRDFRNRFQLRPRHLPDHAETYRLVLSRDFKN